MEANELYNEYVKELISRAHTDYFFGDTPDNKKCEATAIKMLNVIKEGKGRADWLKYNGALKCACKKVGILKSSELREYIKKNYEVKEEE